MPHARARRDQYTRFEHQIAVKSLDELNMAYLNNPRLSRNQRQFIIHAYRKNHPEERRRENREKREKRRHIRKERQVPRGSRKFEQKLAQRRKKRHH